MLSLIVAMTENRVIGRDGGMPWRLSNDLRRFKQITMGHHIIMGRRTFDSIGRALPGRTSVVLSRSAVYDDRAVVVVRNFEEALTVSAGDEEPFITGGSEVFERAMPLVRRIYLTRIHAEIHGDTFFPEIDWNHWVLSSEQRYPADVRNSFDHSFLTYERLVEATPAASDEE
jgi:dihydrofolate reductase